MFAGRVGNPVAWRRFRMEGKTGMEGGGDALAMEGIAMDLLLVAGMTAFSALVRLSEYIGLGLGLLEGPGLDGDCTVLELAFPKVIRTSLNSLRAPNSFSYSAKGSFESKM